MKTILVINDSSQAAAHAVEFACMLAKLYNANIMLANTVRKLSLCYNGEDIAEEKAFSAMSDNSSAISVKGSDFLQRITEIDVSNTDDCALAELINRNKVWMIVKGNPTTNTEIHQAKKTRVHIVLNKINCPLLLIPERWPLKIIKRMTYISDLRYCGTKIIRYLTELAELCQADLFFAYLNAKGLPNMSDEYALNMFTEEVCQNVKYDRLFFNNLKEKDFVAAIDIIVNQKENDMLAFVNHHFHVEEILGGDEHRSCSAPITVPVLIFPH